MGGDDEKFTRIVDFRQSKRKIFSVRLVLFSFSVSIYNSHLTQSFHWISYTFIFFFFQPFDGFSGELTAAGDGVDETLTDSIVLRFIKGTFPTNYIPTIEDTYRQVRIQFQYCTYFRYPSHTQYTQYKSNISIFSTTFQAQYHSHVERRIDEKFK